MTIWRTIDEPLLREALKRRARRNWRNPRQELRAILSEVLAPEIAEIQRELGVSRPDLAEVEEVVSP